MRILANLSTETRWGLDQTSLVLLLGMERDFIISNFQSHFGVAREQPTTCAFLVDN